MVTITFEPYDGKLTEEDYLQILDFANQYGYNVNVDEKE